MNQNTQSKPAPQTKSFIATQWTLGVLYNPFVQIALGIATWTMLLAYIFLARSAPAVTADLLNVLFCTLNVGADLIGLPRLPYLSP
ncbi:hypothetical protein [Acetobacter vaccinii]|uniref:Uncharacterized protein n=1 Tax=Acetobacter vaccinii TaxID=2592655 RepID=A0A5C1YQJ6_9PROT|nr:hypothetical protein [Acetobacter vaccinii]QEO17828.1 hypothetical protein FLP30_08870 [Acetobacter vaccinii]